MADTYYTDSKGRYTINKDPDARLDYTLDWTDWLNQASDVIASATATSDDLIIETISVVNNFVTLWISGGSPNSTASVTYRIVTGAGRVDERTIYFKIKNR